MAKKRVTRNPPSERLVAPSAENLHVKSSDQFRTAFKAFHRIEKSLVATEPMALGTPDLSVLCQHYRAIQGAIEETLDFVEWLPNGPTIRKVIVILMKVADGYCDGGPRPLAIEGERSPFERIEAVLSQNPQGLQALGITAEDTCKQYHALKKYIEPMLAIVEWLPYGPTIARVVRILMRLADAAC